MISDKSSSVQSATLPVVAVCAAPPHDEVLLRGAIRLSIDLDLPLVRQSRTRGVEMLLVTTSSRLELRVVGGNKLLRGGRAVYVDLSKVNTASGPGRSLRQPIARAVGLKRGTTAPTVIDASAGYGADAWLLASLGCQVLAIERHKLVEALLRDGLVRAASVEGFQVVVDRICLVCADALSLLRQMSGTGPCGGHELPEVVDQFRTPDVVYLDPMFPPGRKTAERKPLRVLRRLVGDDTDAGELLATALRVAKQRVVVKRPIRADPLGSKPTTTHCGKATRYDVYVTS